MTKRKAGAARNHGEGGIERVDWEESYRDLPPAANETEAQRLRRERSERVNSYLRQLRQTGTVDYDLVPRHTKQADGEEAEARPGPGTGAGATTTEGGPSTAQ